jgi:ketosteroid isomerase-like protein
MHPHALLLRQLFTALDRRDARAIIDCYHPDATFRDIAFDLHGKSEIATMWRMICKGDIRVTFDDLHADDHEGRAKIVDVYTFSKTHLPVRNVIESTFKFADGLVIEHHDDCDPKAWAAMAYGGVVGFLLGRIAPARRAGAAKKLKEFRESPEGQKAEASSQ